MMTEMLSSTVKQNCMASAMESQGSYGPDIPTTLAYGLIITTQAPKRR